eukprot:2842799-Rhodomonas_salina.1
MEPGPQAKEVGENPTSPTPPQADASQADATQATPSRRNGTQGNARQGKARQGKARQPVGHARRLQQPGSRTPSARPAATSDSAQSTPASVCTAA